MFGFKSKEQLAQEKADMKKELLEEIRADEERRRAEIAEAEEKAREEERLRLEAEEKARLEEAERMKASEEPWVEIKGIVQDPEKGIKIDLDWNDAFVKHLRNNGYVGADDNAVIQRYVAVLAKQVAGDMAADQYNENE